MLTEDQLTDRVLGCVFGGAVGDALGAPFEGLWSSSIPDPMALLAQYAEFEGFPRGQFTDDTQLTVATLQSIVRRNGIEPRDIAASIARLWRSQTVVGPGGACTAAADRLLAGGHWSESGAPVGQAGNGTAMRTAALGGVAIASTARLLCESPELEPGPLCGAVAQDMQPFDPAFAALVARLPMEVAGDPVRALEYVAWSGAKAREFEEVIITPYVVPTVLAALWSVIRFPHSWEESVTAAIRLGGDVDTLGAIVGSLMGARQGLSAVPRHLRESVLDANKLHVLARRYAQVVERRRTN
jgi:ADP-ribosylglycohydrolase